MKILTATIILEEGIGEYHNVEDFNRIITQAITDNTTASIVDGNISMFEIQK